VKPVSGGSIAIDSSAARAGQHSLLAQVNEGVAYCDDCVSVRAGLWLPELHGPTSVTTEFDLRVEQIDHTFGRRIVLFQMVWGTLEAGSTYHTLQIESGGASIRAGLVEYAFDAQNPASSETPWAPVEHGFVSMPALSGWVHVKYALEVEDLSGAGNAVTLTVDDTSVFVGSPYFGLHDADVQMEIGVPWVDMSKFEAQERSKSWRVRYDNVLVRNEPR
jgi:hypothetical protein